MPFLQLRDSRYPLRVGENRVGWGTELDIRLPDADPPAEGVAAVIAVDSSGTASVQPARDGAVLLNGVTVGGPAPVLHGDRIALGSQELRYGDEAQLGETIEVDQDHDVAIAVPSPSARISRSEGRLLSLVDGREYAVGPEGLSIGRDPSCDLVIASPGVSRKHATIRHAAEGYLLLDTSANGVFVNAARVQAELPLGRGDTVRVGPEEFRFYAEAGAEEAVNAPSLQVTGAFRAAARPVPAVAAPTPPGGRPRPVFASLEVINEGPSKGTRFDLDSPRATVGRGEHNDVVLADESVSEFHAKLQRREDAWYVVDLESTNGTYVEGRRITDEVKLPSGTDVRFGGVKLRFTGAGSVARSSGETRVIVGVKGPDPKRAEQRLRELAEHAAPEPAPPARGTSPILWIIFIVLASLAVYAVVWAGGQ